MDLELKSVLGKEAVLVQSMHFSKGVENDPAKKVSLVNGQLLTLQLTQDMFSQLRTILLKATVNIEDATQGGGPRNSAREKPGKTSRDFAKPSQAPALSIRPEPTPWRQGSSVQMRASWVEGCAWQ